MIDTETENASLQTPLTPEQEALIEKVLLEQRELGLYTKEELLQDGTKVMVNSKYHNLGIDSRKENVVVVRDETGKWLSPQDEKYKETLYPVALKADEDTPSKHEEIEQNIKTMVAINEGSNNATPHLDETVLQRLRAGASTMELKNIQGKFAAIAGFASAGEAVDIDPSKLERLQPDPVIPGEVYENAQKEKAKKNAEFAELQRKRREKDNL